MIQELADRLAVAAGWRGWRPSITEGWWWDRNGVSVFAHPFPVGRIDPILDLMRERMPQWFVWTLEEDDQGTASATLCLRGHLAFDQDGPTRYSVAGEGHDLWTALASAVLAAVEKKV